MGQSVGVARHRQDEVDTPEKREKLMETYKAQWNCKEVRISEPDNDGYVSIYELPE